MTDGGPYDERRRRQALGVGLVAAFMTLLDISIVNVALPSLERSLQASPSDLQWVLSGYALAFGLVLVPAGRFGDIRGRRNAFVFGVALFTLASALAGFAQSPDWLVATRLLQGAAAGVVNPQVTGLIQQLYQGPERARPFGLLGATIGISTAVGPLLGGLLIAAGGQEHGWRWVFFVNVPVGIVAVILAWRLLPGRVTERSSQRRLDPLGVLLLGVGVTLVLLPLMQREQWPGPEKWLLVPAGLITLLCFALWERRYARHGPPMFDVRLFNHQSYTLGSLIALLYFGGFTAIFFILTLYLQNGRGYSALVAGLAITPFALGSAVASAVGGRIVNRYGRPLVAIGLLAVVAGLGLTALAIELVPHAPVPWVTAAPLLVAGIGSGLVIAPNQTLTLSQVPVPEAGSGAGMLQTGQRIGSAAGIAAVGAVFFSALSDGTDAWSRAFERSLLTSAGIISLALVAALVDIARHHRQPPG
ncbi:drug resistance transporter, EmrB/QacA subfamily [Micromonospora phaseoli]|uniref:Drug resistance transporter, EmrB/QacA subfamily n=1 Tax=Micromonospora phaseoli TaxID=1144548 RepID=A0A1H7E0C5_9ACTN|nr:MFS transporter [Micromonospora phaseoli]PZV88129.1 EmrB/QacA subfamily drug resistance transporter [Micromonospora phaseoli]GIJ81481.1 MFS transporter [Micromonospora phaseoli]SEK07459.1 drug resistance transporter, EmrB/QacA subfamily [Micromonospora phaseoli]